MRGETTRQREVRKRGCLREAHGLKPERHHERREHRPEDDSVDDTGDGVRADAVGVASDRRDHDRREHGAEDRAVAHVDDPAGRPFGGGARP